MEHPSQRAIAIVGIGAIFPDALNPDAFWKNILGKRYSISEVTPDRWDPALYYDPDPTAPDKTYSKIGGWVRGFSFNWKTFRIPPKVVAAMDESQQWAVTIAAQALADYGYQPGGGGRPLDTERTAVVLGTAMGGERHDETTLRASFPEYARALESVSGFRQLGPDVRQGIVRDWRATMDRLLPPITEDAMPGELANIVSGRVANVFNLRGPNFITDAACASSFAAVDAAVELLTAHHVDAVLTGGVDRNMGASTFIKFCKIGALSASGTRPFGDGADGFVMGEGAAAFLLKRLEDAERAGDKIYAVLRGVGGASDGKGKGITAPNPIGQQLATRRAWENATLDPATATLVEAHGTSTRVGDVVEVESLSTVFGGAPRNGIALGSVKSNIGHLKGAAGAAGLFKAMMALYSKILPPTLNAERPNPNIDFAHTPFCIQQDPCEWPRPKDSPRRAGVSAYGFGGTNFHLVLEEHIPGLLTDPKVYASASVKPEPRMIQQEARMQAQPGFPMSTPAPVRPLRGILALGANTVPELTAQVTAAQQRVESGWTPPLEIPSPEARFAPERLVLDFSDREELLDRLKKAAKALATDNPQAWRALAAQGIFRGHGPKPGKIAFLFPGQGSQYLNMGRELCALFPTVAAVFRRADKVMEPIVGRPLTSYMFVDSQDPADLKKAEAELTQTAICQPAVLTLDIAMCNLLADYGFQPDMVMGHSLGEYSALIVAGIMPFEHALEAAAARGREMARLSKGDNGWMAAVMAPSEAIEAILREVDGYVVAANINSHTQSVIGGASRAVERAIAIFSERGYQAQRIPVSHAFHTRIVAPASAPLRQVLNRLSISSPSLPLISNVNGEFYPDGVEEIKDLLQLQIASPVQWIKGMETLYAAGARAFVEVGPKKALKSFVDDVLGSRGDIISLFTNHPKTGELPSLNQALCGLYAAGYGETDTRGESRADAITLSAPLALAQFQVETGKVDMRPKNGSSGNGNELAELLTQVLAAQQPAVAPPFRAYDRNDVPLGSVVITGTGLGLPGSEKSVMDPDNALRILRGEQFVDLIPERFRKRMLAKRVTRVVKSEDGSGHFETITDPDEVIKLAARPGAFNLTEEYGVPDKLVEALDITTQLAMAAGLDALREAGIPLVQTYKHTTTGKYLPDKWMLPEALRDETGVIFASAFPGIDRLANEFSRYYIWENRQNQYRAFEELRQHTSVPAMLAELGRRMGELREEMEREPYEFDRRFLLRVLSMGHSQFAEYIGARGPNTQVNAACASTVLAIGLAEDWVRSGRCRRVIVIGADNATSDNLLEWVGAGFLASGAAATDDRVEDAALPFDRRRHGTLIGMGACALVIESEDAVRERGMRGVVELLSSEMDNSAFHGTRLNVDHIAGVMDHLVTAAERRFGLNRNAMASQLVFMSHETYTPARGGSAAAEIVALRHTFGDAAHEVIVANTKGFTGHPMGVGVEDVIALKILEYGIVPPVPNLKERDPDLGSLNLSRGGRYPVQYALHLAAGFGSQIAMTLTRRIPGGLDRVDAKQKYLRWLADVSGYDRVETEVYKRVFRIQPQGEPGRPPIASTWERGTGPIVRAWGGQISSPVSAPSTWPASSAQPAPVSEPAIQRVPVAPPTIKPVFQPGPQPNLTTPVTPAAVEPVLPVAAALTPVAPAPERGRIVPLTIEESRTAEVRGTASSDAPTPAPARVESPTTDSVSEKVMEIVASKTGYPREMLDLDLDLEADLGIDTVKQAEVFAAIRESFDIPRQDKLKLRDYPTLKSVIGFVKTMRPDLALIRDASQEPRVASNLVPAGALDTLPSGPTSNSVSEKVMEIVASKTGYPREMLDLDLDLEADLGIDTVKQAETFAAIRESFDIPRQDKLKLRDYPTLKSVIGFVKTMRPDLAASETASTVEAPHSEAARAPEAGQAVRHSEPAPFAGEESLTGTLPGSLASARNDVRDAVLSADVSIAEKVMEIVASKTGYPREMLDLDLDLEADLGIDTVKQAETFAAIRESFDIPRQDKLKLRDYPTLKRVIGFVKTMRPDLASNELKAASSESEMGGASAPETPALANPIATIGTLEDADRMPRRVPTPALRPPLDVCCGTGVKFDAASRVVVALDEGGVGQALLSLIQGQGVTTLPLERNLSAEMVELRLKAWLSEGPIQGVYWLPALDVEPELEMLDLAAWREMNRQRVKNMYVTMRTLYESVGVPGTFLVTGTRLGGTHGYGPEGATAPLGGGVTGFAKAYKRERNAVLVKAVDFAPGASPDTAAQALMAETLADPGVVEVGYADGNRYTVTLIEQSARDGASGLTLNHNTVFVVTGAAGGITSAIIADLAAASGGIFYLLDLVRRPDPKDPHIALFRKDKEELKAALIRQAQEAGERATPVMIDKRILAVEREEAALRSVEAVEAAGGRAYYYSVNLLDGDAVTAVVDDVRKQHGRIDVLVHAGGVEISRSLPDKDPAQFDLVYDIKADGLFSLLRAAQGMPVGATVVFSSVAGRFGNSGQTDYSAANDLMCKMTSYLRRVRPATRAIAVDWTAWGGIGMATRGSIPKIMEMAGIEMLPPESGVPTIRRELTYGGFRGEIVVAGKLGLMVEEWDSTGGLEPELAREWLAAHKPASLMVGDVKAFRLYGGLEVETTLDPNVQPFLYDHAMDGTPLLPGVMGVETFAELACAFAPGYFVSAVENVEFQRAFKFYRMQPQTLYLTASLQPSENGELIAYTTLKSVLRPAHPELPTQEKVHFTARVRLTREQPAAASIPFTPPPGEALQITADKIYQLYFHGPAYRVLERVQVEANGAIGLMAENLPPNTSPADAAAYMSPRLIEFLFQTAGLWDIQTRNIMALPFAIRSVTAYRAAEEAQGRRLYAQVNVRGQGDSFDGVVLDETGAVYVRLEGYRTVQLPGSVSLE